VSEASIVILIPAINNSELSNYVMVSLLFDQQDIGSDCRA
jgi:hypothetical protein